MSRRERRRRRTEKKKPSEKKEITREQTYDADVCVLVSGTAVYRGEELSRRGATREKIRSRIAGWLVQRKRLEIEDGEQKKYEKRS